jgi:hypothetical protein
MIEKGVILSFLGDKVWNLVFLALMAIFRSSYEIKKNFDPDFVVTT